MKTKILLVMLFFAISIPACLAVTPNGRKVGLDRITTVYIRKGVATWTMSGIISGHEVLIRVDKLFLLGLNPIYNSRTGEITLISTRYKAQAKLGSPLVTINGKLEKLLVAPQIINMPASGLSTPQIYIPALRIARSLGYEVTPYKATLEWGHHFDIIAPYYHMQLSDFKNQVIVSPLTQRSDDLEATASLITDAETGTDEPDGNKLIIRIRISNRGINPYYAAREFIYLEQWNEFITDTSSERLGIGDPGVMILPKDIGTIDASWISSQSDVIPIRRIVYTDGWHRFEWKVEERLKAGKFPNKK